ncbi:hypothetical protein BOTBODRAFT_46877 [Botryobasidium botryosum FD-172 SS1]|uniref:Uncharacterized protein n=1 Tax=Botryobasidium botryosum (strain FD-172 SS1) TaxID=930990 RepID=A0A067M513_BOTB1|nr:hypothetical protein BOTBODRAFT_46877 [Botryobasidium botryosum FD-172 SS1]
MSNAVQVPAGYRGTITGVARSGNLQRAKFELKDNTGYVLGVSQVMDQQVDPSSTTWSFGPFAFTATISVVVDYQGAPGQTFKPSKVVAPITVAKVANAKNHHGYIISTVLSEDHTDNDYNDAIISIFQYK